MLKKMNIILQNPLKFYDFVCVTILCNFDAVLLGFCLFLYSTLNLSR